LELIDELADKSIDMVLTDLPYGTTACAWDSVIDLDLMWEKLYRVVKEDAAMVFTASQPFTTKLIGSNINDFRYEWIWAKPQGTNPMLANSMPMKNHENVLVFYQKKPTYNPQNWKSTPYFRFKSKGNKKIGEVYGQLHSMHRDNPNGERYPLSIQFFSQEKGLHPTQKPVEMMAYFIKTYSNEGNWILDLTMGSGTTGVAAFRFNRNFVGYEIDENYFKIANERLKSTRSVLPI